MLFRSEARRVAGQPRCPACRGRGHVGVTGQRKACAECDGAGYRGERQIPAWHPHQLRHSFATKARGEFGLEGAQVALGHARADVTQLYAEKNVRLAAEMASRIG